jgi:chromosome segregation ATPase
MNAGCAKLRKQAAMAVVLVACLFGSALADDAGKTATLNRTLSEIAELGRSINERIDEACALLDRLNEQRELLKNEINQERGRHDITSFRQAVQINRIDYNLRLMQQLTAYIERLNGSVEYCRGANQLLNFYARQARDDLLMLKTLQDADISGLMNKIAAAKNEFEMMLNKPLITAPEPYARSMELIWNDILRK